MTALESPEVSMVETGHRYMNRESRGGARARPYGDHDDRRHTIDGSLHQPRLGETDL